LAADRFAAVADEIGATTMQLALAWLLQRSPAILCIPGTSTLAHLRENLASGEIALTTAQLDELDRLAL
jgi:pyridoxine 4-dehydrogenase